MSALFLFMSLVTWLEYTLPAEISECETKKVISFIPFGNDIHLCCELSAEECNETSEENLMQLLPKGSLTNSSLSQTRCTAEWLIANASKEDSTLYICSNMTGVIGVINITVLDEPTVPQFINILASDQYDIILEFDPGQQKSPSEFSVLLEILGPPRLLCHSNCTNQNGDMVTNCVCIFDNTDQYLLISHNDVTFTIQVSVLTPIGPILSLEVKKTVCLVDHFVPGCVLEFSALNVEEDQALIQFRPAKKTARLIDFMKERGKKFFYYVELLKLDGRPELLKMFFEKKILFDIEFIFPSEIQYAAIEFDELTSFTTYSVTVTGVADNTAGCLRNFTFTTKTSVPASPPDVEAFLFSRFISETNLSSLWLMWKPLSQESRGGNNVSYIVEEVTTSEKLPLNTYQNFITIFDLPNEPAAFHIWSVNEIGHSKIFTEVQVPKITDIAKYNIIVEALNDSHVLAIVDISSNETIQEIAIHACEGDKMPQSTVQDVCIEYPYTKMFDAAHLQQSPVKLLFFMPFNKPEIIEKQKNVTYFEYQDQNAIYDGKKNTATANITLNENEPITSLSMDPFSSLRDLNSADERRKRSAELISAYSSDDQPNLLSLKTLGDSPKFFISIKMGGIWLGMNQAKCYFNGQSTDANVIVLQKNGFLMISQECDAVTPKQFLVYSYQIYSASSLECAENDRHLLGTVNNTFFNDTVFKLPPIYSYICVIAVGAQSSKTVKVVQKLSTAESSPTIMIIIIVVVGTILVCVAIFVICFICKCRRRRYYFDKMTITSKNMSESSTAVNEGTDFTFQPTKVNDPSVTDSGHGTYNESMSETISPSVSHSYQSEIPVDYRQPNSSFPNVDFLGCGSSRSLPVNDNTSAPSIASIIELNQLVDNDNDYAEGEKNMSVESKDSISNSSANRNSNIYSNEVCSEKSTIQPTNVNDPSLTDSGHGTYNESMSENISPSVSHSYQFEIPVDYRQPTSSFPNVDSLGCGSSCALPVIDNTSACSIASIIELNQLVYSENDYAEGEKNKSVESKDSISNSSADRNSNIESIEVSSEESNHYYEIDYNSDSDNED